MERYRYPWMVLASIAILLLLGALGLGAKPSALSTALGAQHSLAAKTAAARSLSDWPRAGAKKSAVSKSRILDAYGKLPMAFEANRGQSDSRVKFLSRGNGYTVFFTPDEAVLTMPKSSDGSAEASARSKITPPEQTEIPGFARDHHAFRFQAGAGRQSSAPAVLRMKLVAAQPGSNVTGLKELPGRSNYFIGNDPRKWRTRIPNYAQVQYSNVYPGIDLIYYGHQGQLEYDFVLAPGASPQTIKLAITGAEHSAALRIDAAGNLAAVLEGGEVGFDKPVVYQLAGVERKYVDGRYVVKGEGEVGFEVAAFDTTKPLIIDPTLSYSTYLGGSSLDAGSGIAMDSVGNAYVTGQTASTDFPTSNPLQPTNHGGSDVFVAALDPSGSTLLYSTYLGGSRDDVGEGIALDGLGNAYATGYTDSTNFPTANPLQPTNHGGFDAFVVALDPTGSTLLYSTYLGGSGFDFGRGIAVDSVGNAYVTGWTNSTNFPTSNPLQPTNHGFTDAFVAEIAP